MISEGKAPFKLFLSKLNSSNDSDDHAPAPEFSSEFSAGIVPESLLLLRVMLRVWMFT